MRFESKEELLEWVIQSSHLWLFLDFDGPLADLACPPESVQPDLKIINLLLELSDNPNIRVAALSKRRLERIRNLFPVSGIFLAGAYGIELLTPAGEAIQRLDYQEVRTFLERIKVQWNLIINGQIGCNMEDEGWTLALYARSESEQLAEQVSTQARTVVREAPSPGDFRVLSSPSFLKIAPFLENKTETIN